MSSFPNIPFWRQSKQMTVITKAGQSRRFVEANDGYWRLKLNELRLARDWVFTTTLHPAFHIQHRFFDEYTQTLIGPEKLGTLQGDVRRVYLAPQIVTPVYPHTGKPCELGLALLAVPGAELAESMLNLVGGVSTALGREDIAAAAGIVDLVRQGVSAILRLDTCQMRLGWVGQIGAYNKLYQSFIIVAPPEASNWAQRNLHISGGRLHTDGQDISRVSYLVFSIEVAKRRSDWRNLPLIKGAFDEFNADLSLSHVSTQKYNARVETLLANIRTSPHLIQAQKDEIIEEIIQLRDRSENQNKKLFRADAHSTAQEIADMIDYNLQQKGLGPHEFLEDDTSDDTGMADDFEDQSHFEPTWLE